jgi:hypothetical protein
MASLKYVLAIVATAALALGGVLYLRIVPQDTAMPARTIIINSIPVEVDVADTEALREQGLSGRLNLPEGQGMLFVFDEDGMWGIWMKDMQFSIDIVWADASGTVITIAPNIAPATYPNSFSPSAPARYVLELPAGFSAAHSIAEGDKIVL